MVLLLLVYSFLAVIPVIVNIVLFYQLVTTSRTTSLPGSLRCLLLNLTTVDLLASLVLYPSIFQHRTLSTSQTTTFLTACNEWTAFGELTTRTIVSYSLVAIAIYWYNSPMIKPYKSPISVRQTNRLIALTWLMAITVSTPMLLYHSGGDSNTSTNSTEQQQHQLQYDNSRANECRPASWFTWHHVSYLVLTLSITHLLPFLIGSFCYLQIAKQIWSNETDHTGGGSGVPIEDSALELLRVTIFISACFVLCWLPFNLMSLITHFLYHSTGLAHFDLLWSVCYVAGLAHVLLRPLTYLMLRSELRKVICAPIRQLKASQLCNRQGDEHEEGDSDHQGMLRQQRPHQQQQYSILVEAESQLVIPQSNDDNKTLSSRTIID